MYIVFKNWKMYVLLY